ncbi:MAG: alpha-L-arabinofuranosidase [Odoribacteraceae bacterium]|jgi:alpha-L-arabinofuranosidase|nr:alpha-L-arabinofuranosidase [Odoribacteraceae bacterium]
MINKKIYTRWWLLPLALALLGPGNAARADVRDSVFLRGCASDKDNYKHGLVFSWSPEMHEWHDVWSDHSFLRSDYGPWGSGKRMLNAKLYRDATWTWHLLWDVDRQAKVFGHASSPDLIHWGRQSFYPKEKQAAFIARHGLYPGEAEATHRVHKNVVDTLIREGMLASHRARLYGEQAKDDSTRFAGLQDVTARLSVNVGNARKIGDRLVGVFFEDISHAADGGLYAELVQNRDFEYDPAEKGGRDPRWHQATGWKKLQSNDADLPLSMIDTVAPLHPNNKHYLAWNPIVDSLPMIYNTGFDKLSVKAGDRFVFSMYARLPGKDAYYGTLGNDGWQTVEGGRVYVWLFEKKTGKLLEMKEILISGEGWNKYTVELVAEKDSPDVNLTLNAWMKGQVDLDMISLFPRKTFKGRANGLRDDLARAIADLKPRFVRFPGGCVAHGDGLANMYRWKNTIGPLEARVPQRNIWGYHQTVGLGYFEYFQFCEDIGAEPVPIVPAGVPCQNSSTGGAGQQGGIPMEEMGAYVQEVLDLIEWANGDSTTTWGRERARAGHPEPFHLKYLGVGNEDLISDVFEERFAMIFEAVKKKHPEITVIGTVGPFSEGTDYREGWALANRLGVPVVDEHYYQPPGWFIYNQEFYDRYDRSKSKVYLGEYAAHLPGRPANLETALAEALHLTTLERNGDVVIMSSYAPLLAKEGHANWNPNLIYFNNREVKPTVGYRVQQLFSENAGDEYLATYFHVREGRMEVKNRVACSIVRGSRTREIILKFVNLLPVNVNVEMDLTNAGTIQSTAHRVVLTGKPDDREARPTSDTVAIDLRSRVTLSPYSLTIYRVKP